MAYRIQVGTNSEEGEINMINFSYISEGTVDVFYGVKPIGVIMMVTVGNSFIYKCENWVMKKEYDATSAKVAEGWFLQFEKDFPLHQMEDQSKIWKEREGNLLKKIKEKDSKISTLRVELRESRTTADLLGSYLVACRKKNCKLNKSIKDLHEFSNIEGERENV